MPARLLAFFAICLSLLPAAQKKVGTAQGENQDMTLTVTLYLDPQDAKRLVGSDLGGYFILADVKVEPKYGKMVAIDRDDFVLRTNKNGENTTPFAPSQIAGHGALIVHQGSGATTGSRVGIGAPGGYPMDYPRPGGVAAGVGSSGGAASPSVTAQNSAGDESALEKTLREKELSAKKTDQPVSGLLYFAMDKQKLKDLELTYGGRDNRITLRFK